jgi:hypothetical protein
LKCGPAVAFESTLHFQVMGYARKHILFVEWAVRNIGRLYGPMEGEVGLGESNVLTAVRFG